MKNIKLSSILSFGAAGLLGKTSLQWLTDRASTTLEIKSDSALYEILSCYLKEIGLSDRVKRATYSMPKAGETTSCRAISQGTHIVYLLRRPCLLTKTEEEKKDHWGPSTLSYTLTIPFLAKAEADRFIQQIIDEYHHKTAEEPQLWYWADGYWNCVGRLPHRGLNTVSLPDKKKEELLQDIKQFHNTQADYQTKGIPWRRGYLFYGKPGTGKSSTTLALANELGLSVAYLALSNSNMSDSSLTQAVTSLPKNTILLLEDIDAIGITAKRKSTPSDSVPKENQEKKGLTLSGLLNIICGVISPEGLITIMTTNHKDNLDEALIRPGRADYRMEFHFATAVQAYQICLRITNNEEIADEAYQDILENGAIAPAAIQESALISQTVENYKKHVSLIRKELEIKKT